MTSKFKAATARKGGERLLTLKVRERRWREAATMLQFAHTPRVLGVLGELTTNPSGLVRVLASRRGLSAGGSDPSSGAARFGS